MVEVFLPASTQGTNLNKKFCEELMACFSLKREHRK
jgi:hypothetical protein